ncbi:MAG: dependent glucose-6-phosphate dehydrogenase [Thermomicrobiales bacterium]|nr:dependent glucose-6-phosphate dehydrogenase [Thermomicrobiales bacterium]
MGEKQRVLVTGASGVIGKAVRDHLSDRYELHALTHRPAEFPSHVADVADLDAIQPAFEGTDAVVHLAASASVATPWEDILHNNLIGTYNVFEASRRAGLKTVIFASSNHTIGMYETDGAPAIYALDDPRVYDHTAELRPDSLYGVSKVYGEALGRYYHELHGLRVYNLRIGSVRADDDPRSPSVPDGSFWLDLTPEQKYDRLRATWLSQRDCADLIAACLDADDVGWAVVYGISDNPRQFWDLSHAREVLGWTPKDGAPE